MSFHLGGLAEPSTDPQANPYEYDADDLTTHGVIVGMTGSGKTGLGVIFLEEALRSGIPTLVIDPKGDMTNLLLTFPDLAPADFEPWVDVGAAEKEGKTAADAASDASALWTKGLGSWGIAGSDIADLRSKVGMTIYTPGSEAGNPVNVVGTLKPPTADMSSDMEAVREEIEGFASGLLGLVDIDADPVSSREHILISNLVERAWGQGRSLDLGDLITQIANPPMRKLGVFEVEQFFPEKDRMALAMKLNGLLASPSFAPWMTGVELDIEALLWHEDKPQAAVMYLAHLSDTERQFVVTMVLSKLITWMRSQPGSSNLRVLVYMDEVFGFVPPTANPPAKRPILTILKQARAFGVGMLLSTQNPVDLDYKAMSNAGTWCIGRLQTERDKARIVEALKTASGAVDTDNVDATISKLPKRTFVLHSTRETQPAVFSTRWAMSYLRGPMTRDEVGRFKKGGSGPATSATPDSTAPDSATTVLPPPPAASTTSAPEIAAGIPASAIHPAAAWRGAVGDTDAGTMYHAGLAATVSLRFDEARAGIDHTEIWEAVLPHLDITAVDAIIDVDHDPRDFVAPVDGVGFADVDAPISQTSFFDDVSAALKRYADEHRTATFYRNRDLKLVSRGGEDESAFTERCRAAAIDEADKEKAGLAKKYEARIRNATRAYEDAVRDADLAAQEVEASNRDALIGFGLDLLTGRKPRTSRSSTRSAENRQRRAESKIDDARGTIEDLNDELEERCADIDDEWQDKAETIDTLDVGLESDDITVDEIRVVWIRR